MKLHKDKNLKVILEKHSAPMWHSWFIVWGIFVFYNEWYNLAIYPNMIFLGNLVCVETLDLLNKHAYIDTLDYVCMCILIHMLGIHKVKFLRIYHQIKEP